MPNVFSKYDSSLRILVLVHHGGLTVCRAILHNYQYGLPKDEVQLNLKLRQCKNAADLNRCKWKLYPDQESILFPPTNKTDGNKFDLTLIIFVIKKCIMLPLPATGKQSLLQLLNELLTLRNKLAHCGEEAIMTLHEFNLQWNYACNLLQSLGFDITTVADLKTCSLDSNVAYEVEWLKSKIDILEQTCMNLDKKMDVMFRSFRQALLTSSLEDDVNLIKQVLSAFETFLTDGGNTLIEHENRIRTLEKMVSNQEC